MWAAALLLALPWLTNTGARFLMPAVALAAIALGMVLPRPAAWAAIAIQAVLCWPHVLDTWETRYSFRLHEFPLAAAVGSAVGEFHQQPTSETATSRPARPRQCRGGGGGHVPCSASPMHLM